MTAILNPKVAMFQLALFPQFIDPSQGSVLGQSLILGATQITIVLMGDAGFVLAAADRAPLVRGAATVGRVVEAAARRRVRRAGGAPGARRAPMKGSPAPAAIYVKLVLVALAGAGPSSPPAC